ncbi:MAG: CBS domain-containing protein [Pseudomonadota bacterium]
MAKRVPQVLSAMTPFPHSVDRKATISEAQIFMLKHWIRHLPVTDGTELVGLVTDRDIKLMQSLPRAADDDLLQVHDICVEDIYTADISESLCKVLETMVKRHIGCALVTKADKLVGIFTSTDACERFADYLARDYSLTPDDTAA